MKRLIVIIFGFILLGCGNYDYNISELPSNTVKYENLPFEIKKLLNDPSDYKEYDSNGHYLGLRSMICLKCDDFKFETIKTWIKSWVDYYKLNDLEKKISYRIDYGFPFPYIIFDGKLYLPNKYNLFIGDLDTEGLEFKSYNLK